MTTTTFTIDCDTCPARGRLCGDCFVPVLGRTWLQAPQVRGASTSGATGTPETPQALHASVNPPDRDESDSPERTLPRGVALDSDELAAVSAFVRAGLVDPDEAAQARAQLTGSARFAAG